MIARNMRPCGKKRRPDKTPVRLRLRMINGMVMAARRWPGAMHCWPAMAMHAERSPAPKEIILMIRCDSCKCIGPRASYSTSDVIISHHKSIRKGGLWRAGNRHLPLSRIYGWREQNESRTFHNATLTLRVTGRHVVCSLSMSCPGSHQRQVDPHTVSKGTSMRTGNPHYVTQ